MISPARRAAYEVLLRVFEQDAYADRAFRSAAEGLDERERAFAQRLAYGSVQRVRTLDHAIETLGRRPVRKLDPPVLAALRLGAYQLGYTDTAPHAAVNESVELVRRARLERAVPFTNAVMRRLSDGIRPLLESLPDGPLKESYPDWIHEIFVRVLGEEGALALMRAMNEPLETVVRLVRGEPPAGAEATDVPGAYRVARVDEALVAEGRVWPQSRGSQLAGLCVGSQEGERVLDLCAAPGGKAGPAARRGDGGRDRSGARARAAREPRDDGSRRRDGRRGGRDGAAAGARRLRPRPRRRTVLGPRRPRPAARTCAGARARSPTSNARSSARLPSGCGRAARSSTPSAR